MWRVAGSGAPTVGLPRRRCRRNGLVDGGWARQAGAHGLLRLVFVGQETVGLCVYPLYVHMSERSGARSTGDLLGWFGLGLGFRV